MRCGFKHELTQAKPAQVIELRLRRRWGADHIAHEVKLAASTEQNILRRRTGRFNRGDRAHACPLLFACFTAAREYAVAGQWPNVKDAGEFPMNSFS